MFPSFSIKFISNSLTEIDILLCKTRREGIRLTLDLAFRDVEMHDLLQKYKLTSKNSKIFMMQNTLLKFVHFIFFPVLT